MTIPGKVIFGRSDSAIMKRLSPAGADNTWESKVQCWCSIEQHTQEAMQRWYEGHMHAEAESRCRGRVRHTWLTAQKGGIRQHVARRMILEDQYNSERPRLEQQCVRKPRAASGKQWSSDDHAMTQKEDGKINSRGEQYRYRNSNSPVMTMQ
ncbi:hypothetical protein K438DRAFT_1791217 [Mycena galopus ATCC 62051]|nr:hypothetical protein K438DRAFT_1791217 [Mycena galopus ATCC 62051]